MSFGKMNKVAYLQKQITEQDDNGFSTTSYVTIASLRVFQEGRHGSERWVNLAAFTDATDLFRMRYIPGMDVTTDMFLLVGGTRYDIESVENVRGRGMYVEVLAKRSEASIG